MTTLSRFTKFWRCVNDVLVARRLPPILMGRAHAYWLANYSVAKAVEAEARVAREAA